MRFPKRDIIATVAVAAAVLVYVLWLFDAALFGMGTRVTGIVVLALGFVASAVAVVPGFDQLMHGNRTYLAVTALLGLVAFGAGVATLWTASSTAFAVLVVAMVVLWAISTTHHVLLAKAEPTAPRGDAVPTGSVPTGSRR